jgi:hypothetical protein
MAGRSRCGRDQRRDRGTIALDMSRLAIAILTSLALSLGACAEKPGTKKDDKKDAKKDGKAKAEGDADAKSDEKSGEEKGGASKERKPPAE